MTIPGREPAAIRAVSRHGMAWRVDPYPGRPGLSAPCSRPRVCERARIRPAGPGGGARRGMPGAGSGGGQPPRAGGGSDRSAVAGRRTAHAAALRADCMVRVVRRWHISCNHSETYGIFRTAPCVEVSLMLRHEAFPRYSLSLQSTAGLAFSTAIKAFQMMQSDQIVFDSAREKGDLRGC